MGPPQDPQGLALSGNIPLLAGRMALAPLGSRGLGSVAELPLSWPGELACWSVEMWLCSRFCK